MDLKTANHAFVTGGASGLGLGIADALAARGLRITIGDILPDLLSAVLTARPNRFRGVTLDVRDRDGWNRAKMEAEAAFGPVDVLVNNAGIAPDGRTFADMNPQSFDRVLGINLVGVVNGVFAFAGGMRDRGSGHIVNTASVGGLSMPGPGLGGYTVAKYGVVALSETAREELAPHGVGVSVLCPDFVLTGLGENTVRIGGELSMSGRLPPPTDVTPTQVGDAVIDGIERNAAYIFTHRDSWPPIERRMREIEEACRRV